MKNLYESIKKSKRKNKIKRAKTPNKNFTKGKTQMVHKYNVRCSTSILIKEMKIKTPMRYHFIPLDQQKLKRLSISSFAEEVEQ